MLDELSHAPLKLQQRVSLLKRHLLPKVLHELVLGAVHRNTLKRLDTQVRQHLRRWLRLPADTPTAFLHAPVNDGGLGVPCLAVLVPFAKRRRLDSVLASSEPAVRAAATVPSAYSGLRLAAQPVRFRRSVLASKEDARNYWKSAFYSSADGRPLAAFAKSACASQWLSSPARVFPWLYLRGIQLREGVLSTKSRRNRRTGISDDLCRGQCGQRETLFHILQFCQLTHQARVWRHNQVMKLLATKLVKRGHKVLLEPHIPEGRTFRKPDIVVCGEDGLTVVDIAIAGEELMESVYAGKIRYNSAAEVQVNL
uniref:Retrovirus-related Pol polyprotein from type-2 retrotransposable element R2DM n=1 Tax=Schistocephalus solidus TaxID=70667 RepID=A0A0V0JC37_SCHSO